MSGWSSTKLPCSSCRAGLFLAHYAGVDLYACSGCGGAWLDNEGCRRITQATMADDFTDIARTIDATPAEGAGGYRDAARSMSHERRCPWCTNPLRRAVIAQIEVDACPEHGTFFDRTELHALNQAFALKAASDDAFVAQFRRDLLRSGTGGGGWPGTGRT